MKTNKLLIIALIISIGMLSLLYFEFPIKIIKPVIHKDIINKFSKHYNIDPLLVTSVIKEESNFNEKARSRSGAMGLMQIMPATAKDLCNELEIKNFKIQDLEDPEINIHIGTYYLSKLLKEFDGKKILALAAYNAGMGKTKNWYKENPLVEIEIKDIPYKETSEYVESVMRTYKWLTWLKELKNLVRNTP
jgi:soluble lytic murein transglycosylase